MHRATPRHATGFLLLAACLLIGAPVAGQRPDTPVLPPHLRAQYDSAYFAWDRGDYPAALRRIERILTAPDGERLVEPIALLTGELFRVQEIAEDGAYVRWSPDGSHVAFERGRAAASRIQLLEVGAGGAREAASFPGWGAAFSPDGAHLAYMRIPESEELDLARADEVRALETGDALGLREIRSRIAALESVESQIVVRALADGSETLRDAPQLERYGLAYAGDGSLLVVGRRMGESDRLDLYLLPEVGEAHPLTSGPGMKGATILPVRDDRIVYTIGGEGIGILSLATGEVRLLDGTSPAISADGSMLAYLSVLERPAPELRRGEAVTGADGRGTGDLLGLMLLPLDGAAEPRVLRRSTLPLASPALSPSGRRVAFMTVFRDDWEILALDVESGVEERVTREIQHDLFPQFLGEDRLLALMGEARHRRAYLYELGRDRAADIATSPLPGYDQRARRQLFHNNTIRTVAPQYEWAPSPDGRRILVVADRDGDTLSPERGVYLVDLEARVTREELLERVRAQLEGEVLLRDWAQRLFEPIEGEVREASGRVETGRIYDHAHALYQFGSKFFTQPGNAHAIEYLARSLRAMGYEPELQWFEPRPGFRTANVVATLRGTFAPERINVISSHFDSVERSPGADDNSSGTTALLEAARVLADRPQPETIRFAFLTAEEAGLLGGREFVRRSVAAGERIVSVINNDMVGWTRNHRLDNTVRYSNDTVRDVQHGAAILFSELITYDARYVRSTDAQAFWDVYGNIVGGIGSYPILGNPHYHQPHDSLEVVNHRLVAEVARATVAAIMLLANGLELEGGEGAQ
jgi:hypothetical protein